MKSVLPDHWSFRAENLEQVLVEYLCSVSKVKSVCAWGAVMTARRDFFLFLFSPKRVIMAKVITNPRV